MEHKKTELYHANEIILVLNNYEGQKRKLDEVDGGPEPDAVVKKEKVSSEVEDETVEVVKKEKKEKKREEWRFEKKEKKEKKREEWRFETNSWFQTVNQGITLPEISLPLSRSDPQEHRILRENGSWTEAPAQNLAPVVSKEVSEKTPADVSKQIPAGIPGNQKNNYHRANGQNTGNFLTDRPSTKVHAAPGGGSSLDYLFGGGSN
ncbi:unnamed protein product [Fraxinus pennsylvanica]|uniref:Uncharacterized protein n=1 Tax=Fraxinus pennsylvanica TaxID=56036 RepID=A0AAD1YPZ1_9LAMI|nr:unnamed protein product [Fraxinus pennsylvanica]